jgi:hypothetical protein
LSKAATEGHRLLSCFSLFSLSNNIVLLLHGLWSSTLLIKRFTTTLLLFPVIRVIASATGSRTTCIQFYEYLIISYILSTYQFHFLRFQLLLSFLPSQLRIQHYLLRLFFDSVLLSAHTFFFHSLSFISFFLFLFHFHSFLQWQIRSNSFIVFIVFIVFYALC